MTLPDHPGPLEGLLPADPVLDHVGVGVFVADRSGRLLWANAALAELFELPVRELLSERRTLGGLVAGDVPLARLGDHADVDVDVVASSASSRRMHLRLCLRPVDDPRADGGGGRKLVGTVVDISGEHALTTELTRLRRRWAEVAAALDTGLAVIDGGGTVVDANPALLRQIGRTTVVGTPLVELVDPRDRDQVADQLAAWPDGSAGRTFRQRWRQDDGTVLHTTVTMLGHDDPQGHERVLLVRRSPADAGGTA